MTAWSEIQDDWAKNSEEENMTGVLLWDLSAAEFTNLNLLYINRVWKQFQNYLNLTYYMHLLILLR